jgi:ABC-type bacteriocin/lantibiotic exporter with double-glycine peptidase domain
MNIELPLYAQEKDNTCALACLRMVLAAFGTDVTEATIEAQARLDEEGTDIGELERLARHFNLVANIQEATVEDLQRLLDQNKLAIAYIDRAVYDLTPAERTTHRLRDAKLHTVIPVRLTAKSVTYHDPQPPSITRRSLRLFHEAYTRLGSFSVVCSKPELTSPRQTL